jgi:hypothetical protein
MNTGVMAPNLDDAQAFAERWYAAWNARDIDAIMACYEPQIEHSSPSIKRYNGVDDAWIKGIDGVRDYFARALERNPTLRFDPKHVAVGKESIILVYTRMTGDLAAEVFVLSERGRILRSVSHYGRGVGITTQGGTEVGGGG